jgi:aminoglycoside 2'-N-acetyltransferase I
MKLARPHPETALLVWPLTACSDDLIKLCGAPLPPARDRAGGTSLPGALDAMRILTSPEAELAPELRLQVAALEHQAWASIDPAVGKVHDPALEPLSMLLLDDGRVVAALAVLSKPILHRGERYAASGLSTVVTDHSLRRRGFGRRLVVAARELIAASDADLGIFTCDTPLAAFYESAGWDLLPGVVLVGGTPEDPLASDSFDKVTLGLLLSERAQRHHEDFRDARIDLYPGPIDRLW